MTVAQGWRTVVGRSGGRDGRDGRRGRESVATWPPRRSAASSPTADADILEYLTATVDTALEDGDDLAEALGDLLISHELCEDEDAATALCGQLSAELKSSAAPVAAAATPSTLLQKPLQMGSFEASRPTAPLRI